MFLKQLSVFIENRTGSLDDVLSTLAQNNINIIALSLADTAEYGMLRVIVGEPELAQQALKEARFSAKLTDIICIKVEHRAGSLSETLKKMSAECVGVEYMYAFSIMSNAFIAVKFSEPAKAVEVLQAAQIPTWTQEDIRNLQ